MTLLSMIDKLNADLRNEWKHMCFYLYHASALTGLHAEEYKEVFLEEAAAEMKHVTEFSDLIWGLGGTPATNAAEFPQFTDVVDALTYALQMEQEVVRNYVERLAEADALPEPEASWLVIFLEEQIGHSRRDVDRYRRLLTGVKKAT